MQVPPLLAIATWRWHALEVGRIRKTSSVLGLHLSLRGKMWCSTSARGSAALGVPGSK